MSHFVANVSDSKLLTVRDKSLPFQLPKYPARIEGWLNVIFSCDEYSSVFNQTCSLKNMPLYCVVFEKEKHLRFYRSENEVPKATPGVNVVRLDGSRQIFCRHWGFLTDDEDSLEFSLSNSKTDGIVDSKSCSMTSSEAAAYKQRRSSVQIGSSSDSVGHSSKFVNFLQRRGFHLKRTKSVTKLDRRKSSLVDQQMQPQLQPQRPALRSQVTVHDIAYGIGTQSVRVRSSRSYESLVQLQQQQHPLFRTPASSIMKLGGSVNARPLHPSLLGGQPHCLSLGGATDMASRFLACRTGTEANQWLQCLRRTLKPDLENERHKENSLKLWVLEAKSLPVKKRYFCEVCLDRTLYARTTTKQKNGTDLFWGEIFDLNNLPEVRLVTINIYREAEKKKKKDRNQLLGCVHIPVDSINSRSGLERWYIIEAVNSNGVAAASQTSGGSSSSPDSTMSIRIKARYQCIDILPLYCYMPLKEFLTSNYMCLLRMLEKALPVKAKEDLALPLVSLFQRMERAPELLSDLVEAEVEELENSVVFRGNSLATKSMECYLKLVGAKYLQHMLANFIREVLRQPDSCESDPGKVESNTVLQRNQQSLLNFSEILWAKILHSFTYFPLELRQVFTTIRQRMSSNGHADSVDNLISASIFLRFVCPAVMSPSLFGLSQEYPDERTVRNCTLIAKVIQSLANASRFEGKEGYMNFMNPFIENHMTDMRSFLRKISNANAEASEHPFVFDGDIDLGYELALIHLLLTEYFKDFVKQDVQMEDPIFASLDKILCDISFALTHRDKAFPRSASAGPQLMKAQTQSPQQGGGTVQPPPPPSSSKPPQAPIVPVRVQSRTMTTPHVLGHSSSLPASVLLPPPTLQSSNDEACLQSIYHEEIGSDWMKATSHQRTASASISPYACVPVTIAEDRIQEDWSRILRAASKANGPSDIVDGLFPPELRELLAEIQPQTNTATSFNGVVTSLSSGYQSHASSSLAPNPPHSLVTESGLLVGTNPVHYFNPTYISQAETTTCESANNSSSRIAIKHFAKPASSSSGSSPTTSHSGRQNSQRHSISSSCSDDERNLLMVTPFSLTSSSVVTGTPPRPRPRKPASLPRSTSAKSDDAVSITPIDLGSDTDWSYSSYRRQQLQQQHQQTSGTSCDTLASQDDEMACSFAAGNGKRRSSANSSAVRMGVRSVQRMMHEKEKSKAEYERDIDLLCRTLQETQERLAATEQLLLKNEQQKSSMLHTWHERIELKQEALRLQQHKKDEQMRNIIQRLQNVEVELRREQAELQEIVTQKERVIEKQQHRIRLLEIASNSTAVNSGVGVELPNLSNSGSGHLNCSRQLQPQRHHHHRRRMSPASLDSTSDSCCSEIDNIEDALSALPKTQTSTGLLRTDNRTNIS